MGDLLAQIRALLAGGATVLTLGSGWFLIGPPEAPPPSVRIGAFNIQVFGRTKAGRPEVMDALARTVREFDVLLVQEIRDVTEQVADQFLDLINEGSAVTYAMHEGPRLGRTSSREQYAIYYRQDEVELLAVDVVDDPEDRFEREPIVVSMRAGGFDFRLVGIHIKPDSALQELRALEEVVRALLEPADADPDIIVLGDLNADCRYLDEEATD